jgi:Fe-S-cluster-containing hydrogenase component 2
VVINPVTCVGCETCFNQCPYDAIRMVEIRNKQGGLVLGQDAEPILKATKCDLCIEQIGGPACQRACPHGALARQNLSDLDEFADWLTR